MNKLIQAMMLVLVIVGLVVSAGPTITEVIKAVVPLVVAIGIVAALLRCVWFYTR